MSDTVEYDASVKELSKHTRHQNIFFIDDVSNTSIRAIIEEQKTLFKENASTLLLFIDDAADGARSKDLAAELGRLYTKSRHFGVSIIVAIQSVNDVYIKVANHLCQPALLRLAKANSPIETMSNIPLVNLNRQKHLFSTTEKRKSVYEVLDDVQLNALDALTLLIEMIKLERKIRDKYSHRAALPKFIRLLEHEDMRTFLSRDAEVRAILEPFYREARASVHNPLQMLAIMNNNAGPSHFVPRNIGPGPSSNRHETGPIVTMPFTRESTPVTTSHEVPVTIPQSTPSSTLSRLRSRNDEDVGETDGLPPKRRKGKCHNCNDEDHDQRKCTKPCRNCSDPGHRVNKCPIPTCPPREA
ncbi:hypothetical protein BC832DRAFT_596214 [Gaertneriomyces semiglobifer]|nr:hypothetical protein BC832DRAFT_596214 [Gaertneriomyces semiglobifer]